MVAVPVSALGAQVPEAIVGLWKGVSVPAEFNNRITGAGIALSGWSGQLKLRADGSYELEEYREGAIGNCRVSILQRSRGRARADGRQLTLAPTAGTESKRDGCDRSGSYSDRQVTPRQEQFGVTLEWTEALSGWMTVKLVLQAMSRERETYVYSSILSVNEPWPTPRIGRERGDAPPRRLFTTWREPAKVPAGFTTGAAPFVPPNTDASWLRLDPNGSYEWVGWRADLVPGPGCTRGVMVRERGTFSLTVAEHTWQQTMTTVPTEAEMVDRVTECGADNAERRSTLPLVTSRYLWAIGRTVNNEEVLEIRCSKEMAERSQWQFAFCHRGFEFRVLLYPAG
jgi:hypothetical protein